MYSGRDKEWQATSGFPHETFVTDLISNRKTIHSQIHIYCILCVYVEGLSLLEHCLVTRMGKHVTPTMTINTKEQVFASWPQQVSNRQNPIKITHTNLLNNPSLQRKRKPSTDIIKIHPSGVITGKNKTDETRHQPKPEKKLSRGWCIHIYIYISCI